MQGPMVGCCLSPSISHVTEMGRGWAAVRSRGDRGHIILHEVVYLLIGCPKTTQWGAGW